jgi:hypothetical protein
MTLDGRTEANVPLNPYITERPADPCIMVILVCPGCGGRLRLISTIEHRAVIDKILRHLGLPTDIPEPSPPRHPAWLPGLEPPLDPATEWPT